MLSAKTVIRRHVIRCICGSSAHFPKKMPGVFSDIAAAIPPFQNVAFYPSVSGVYS
jgi:hypothetical protein